MTITRTGERYAEKVLPAFEAIASATETITKGVGRGALRVRAYTTFSSKWLIPRLSEFKRLYPSIEVRLSTAVPDVDFDRDSADVAIQFGDGKWSHLQTDLLFPDEIEPVCSPGYLAATSGADQVPELLLRQRLLVAHYRRSDWDDWAAATGLQPAIRDAERMTFGSSLLTWQAAADGMGVAIGQKALLQHELQAGVLLTPFRRPVLRKLGHFLVRPRAQRESLKVRAFRDWILGAAGS